MKLYPLFLAATVLAAQDPLSVTGGLPDMVDRHLTAMAMKHLAERSARVAAIRTPEALRERQAYIRRTMLAEIGGLPEKTPLNAKITGTLERDGYRVEKLIYESQPRYYVTASVLVPKTGRAPFPAVIGTAGHSLDGKAYEVYQRAWIGMAKRGILVLAYDPPGQGERFEYLDPATGKSRLPGGGTGEHSMAGLQCLLTGTTIARWFIQDGIRALDYLLTRGDVDPKRIGVTGNSGGGTQSSYLAAFEPRLAAAAPACYITSWEKLWSGPGPQDAEQVFPRFLADGLDFPDFLVAFAPKPIQMATAIKDFFPIDGARATYAEAQRTFQVLGAGDRMGYFEFDDPHGWSPPRREATYRWFSRWLLDRPDDGAEGTFDVDPPKALYSTTTGQVSTSIPGAETVQSMNAALAEQLQAKRTGAGGKDLPALIRSRLRMASATVVPASSPKGKVDRQGYRIEKIELRAEPDIVVPALAFVPAGGAARKPAVLWVNAAGKAKDAEEGGPIERVVRSGRIVLAVDPRGWGEGAPPPGTREGYTRLYQRSMRAILVGRTMAGMQTADVLGAFAYLAARPDVDAKRIAIVGKGNGGVVALFAAALEPRIARVACEKSPASYLEIVRQTIHQGNEDIIVPGVLLDFDLPEVAASLGARRPWLPSEANPDYVAWLAR
jgi:cephalosporin-C deacetylase-like acetyl esterase